MESESDFADLRDLASIQKFFYNHFTFPSHPFYLARESYEADTFSRPGTAVYTVPIAEPDPLVWGYVWCSANAETLASNMEKIQLKFMLNDKEVSSDSLAAYELETGGQVCRLVYTTLSDWTPGEHHLTTTATFTAGINDGSADYEPGDYVLDYTVYVKP